MSKGVHSGAGPAPVPFKRAGGYIQKAEDAKTREYQLKRSMQYTDEETTFREKPIIQRTFTKKATVIEGDSRLAKTGRALERVGRAAAGVATVPLYLLRVPGSPLAEGVKAIHEETLEAGFTGEIKRTLILSSSEGAEDPTIAGLGFNPKSRTEIRTYLQNPHHRAQLRQAGDHLYLPLRGSRFIFIKDGDLRNPENFESIKVWNANSGKPLNQEALLRAAQSYCRLSSLADKAWDTEATKICERMNKKRKRTNIKRLAAGLPKISKITPEQVKKQEKTIVIDPQNHYFKVFGDIPTDMNPGSYLKGTVVDLKDEGAWKDIDRIYQLLEDDNKLDNSRDRPFPSKVPPAPGHHGGIGPDDYDSEEDYGAYGGGMGGPRIEELGPDGLPIGTKGKEKEREKGVGKG